MSLNAGHTVIYVDQHNKKFHKNGNCIYVPYPYEDAWPKKFRYRKIMLRWLMAARFLLIKQQYKPDIIHIHHIANSAFYCASANLHPLILTAWGSDINDFFPLESQNKIRLKKIAYILNSADHITADTQEVLTRCEILASRQLSTSLFYYGIDLDKFKPFPEDDIQRLRQNMRISSNAKVILSVRRLIPKMRHDLVIKAFSQVLSMNNFDVVLVFREALDRDDKYVDQLKQLTHELGVANRVIWQEESDYEQMLDIYNVADVVINFPNQDGLPVSLFEAAACMKPVITSDLKAYKEFLENGGFFRVQVENTSSLADTLETVLLDRNQNLTSRLKANYELVIRKAEQNKCYMEMQRVYASILE